MAKKDLIVKEIPKAPAFLKNKSLSSFEEFAGGLAQGMPLPVLSIRGKVFRVRKSGEEINLKMREMPFVLVAARKNLSKRFYKDSYVSGEIVAPTCMSVDGITPDVANPVAASCTSCPHNAWGSKITQAGKKGKLCSDYKRVVVWIIGTDTPVVLDLPATSLKAPKAERGQGHMMYADYMGQLVKNQMDPTTVVTVAGFTDAEYPQLWMNFDRYVTEKEFATVQEYRATPEVEEVLSQAVVEGDMEISTVAEPEPEPVEETILEPEPEPEPEPVEDADEAAVLAELKSLLG